MEKTADVLLLVRPDYTIYDEVRKTRDFEIFADMRLAGVGMIGVVHANRAIDAVQRLIGRVELGVIPQVVDTVIFIDKGVLHIVDFGYAADVAVEHREDVRHVHGMLAVGRNRAVRGWRIFRQRRHFNSPSMIPDGTPRPPENSAWRCPVPPENSVKVRIKGKCVKFSNARYGPPLLVRPFIEPMADVTQLALTDQFLPDGLRPLIRRDDLG